MKVEIFLSENLSYAGAASKHKRTYPTVVIEYHFQLYKQ